MQERLDSIYDFIHQVRLDGTPKKIEMGSAAVLVTFGPGNVSAYPFAKFLKTDADQRVLYYACKQAFRGCKILFQPPGATTT